MAYQAKFVRIEGGAQADTFAYTITDGEGVTKKWSTPNSNISTVWNAMGTDLLALAPAGEDIRIISITVQTGAIISS